MYIQCTKKLLANLKQPHGELSTSPELIYCWHASFIDHRDLRFAVMMNDETGEDLFFPVPAFQDFPKLLLKKMKEEMKGEGLSSTEISAYFTEAGPVMFGPATDRSLLARLNGSTRRMKALIDKMHTLRDLLDDESQRAAVTAHFEEILGTVPAKAEKTRPKISQSAISRLGSTPMVELNVGLSLMGNRKVERNFLVPLNITFSALHVILQIGFGWYDCHIHAFYSAKRTMTIGPKASLMGLEQDESLLDEDTTILADIIPSVKQIEYLYDFGDSWEHVIKVGKIMTVPGGPYAECTGGRGSTPPEDCGGAPGYEDLCEILNDPSHEEYEEMLEWVGDDFDVGFDKKGINEELAKFVFTPQPPKKKRK